MQDGASFWKVAECFVRGSAVKYVRLQEELVDSVKDIKTQREFPALVGFGAASRRSVGLLFLPPSRPCASPQRPACFATCVYVSARQSQCAESWARTRGFVPRSANSLAFFLLLGPSALLLLFVSKKGEESLARLVRTACVRASQAEAEEWTAGLEARPEMEVQQPLLFLLPCKRSPVKAVCAFGLFEGGSHHFAEKVAAQEAALKKPLKRGRSWRGLSGVLMLVLMLMLTGRAEETRRGGCVSVARGSLL